MVNEKMGFRCGLGARRCDSCKSAPSVLFCRPDAAYLCGACDPRAHGDVAARHEREWLCEVCEQAPATITCKVDAAALCAACDADIHSANPLARRHERAPFVSFVDPLVSGAAIRPAAAGLPHEAAAMVEEDEAAMEVASAAASWTLSNPCVKVLMETPEGKSAQEFLFEMDPYLDLEYANTRDARFQQADRVVPVQEKPTAGEGGAATPVPFPPTDCAFELDFVASKPSQSTYIAESLIHNVSSLEFGLVPDGSGAKGQATDVTDPHASGGVGRAADRKARVMRYREKRKTRRFEKTIRYATRKAYAETRPRIKGRFVKRTEIEAEKVGRMYSRSALMVDAGYGGEPKKGDGQAAHVSH